MPDILSGWKDIANYMGKGVRTVQRYERELGLPVRRLPGKTKGSVLATKTQLDVWIHQAFKHGASHEKILPSLKLLHSQVAHLKSLLEKLTQSRIELAMSRIAVQQTVQRIHTNLIPNRTPQKSKRSRAA